MHGLKMLSIIITEAGSTPHHKTCTWYFYLWQHKTYQSTSFKGHSGHIKCFAPLLLPSCSHSSRHKQHSELTSIKFVWFKWFARTGCALACSPCQKILTVKYLLTGWSSSRWDKSYSLRLRVEVKTKFHLTNRKSRIIDVSLALVFVHYT